MTDALPEAARVEAARARNARAGTAKPGAVPPQDLPADTTVPAAATAEVAPAEPAQAEPPAPDVELLDPLSAARALDAAPRAAARGFLGADPVTQNPHLTARHLAAQDAQVLRRGDALLGYAPNPLQPRQARVATTSPDPEPLLALLEFLRTYHRCFSFVAETPADSPVLPALEACGFTSRGVLPGHLFRSGRHVDVQVHALVRRPDTADHGREG